MLTDTYLRSVAGDEQRFDVGPGTLAGGFLANDTVTFTAIRKRGDVVPVISVNGIYQSASLFRVVISETLTVPFTDFAPTDLYWDVKVNRQNGDGPYTLARGIWRVEAST
jgi:hypothetical protein